MFYINQLLTSSFTIGFVKIESGFIVRSVETGLQRWGLVVAVIIVELMLILFWLSQTWPVSFRIQELVFFGYTVLPDSKEIELESNNQEGSPSAGKNSRVVLVPFLHMEVHPYSYLRWCGCFWGPWVSFFTTDEFSVRATKITSRIALMNSQSTFLFLTYLNLMDYGHIIKSIWTR